MSAPEIDFDKLREDGITSSTDQIIDAVDVLVALLDVLDEQQREMIRRHPAFLIGLARLAKMDEQAEVRRITESALLELAQQIMAILKEEVESAQRQAGDNEK